MIVSNHKQTYSRIFQFMHKSFIVKTRLSKTRQIYSIILVIVSNRKQSILLYKNHLVLRGLSNLKKKVHNYISLKYNNF